MPSGPAYLHRMFGDDWVAWTYLRRRGFFRVQGGIIVPPYQGYKPNQREENALGYLFMEWDWCYEPSRALPMGIGMLRLHQYRLRLRRLFAGPLRVWDKHVRNWSMWWHCVARYEIRKRWHYATGRRKEWDLGEQYIDFGTGQDL